MSAIPTDRNKTAMVMAGGTGGHIFPGLAVAHELRDRGWQVHWLGNRQAMEGGIVPQHDFAFEHLDFSGVRGKGFKTLALLPFRLMLAFVQSVAILRRIKPDVVVGMGGYITFAPGFMAALMGVPLVLHEQNSVAGWVNRVLAPLAKQVFMAFPHVFKRGEWVGNPLRLPFVTQPHPSQRFAGRTGPLRLLVVGGSLGAQALNTVVPQALALMPLDKRPSVIHQGGAKQIDALRLNYALAGVQAELTPFIQDTASAFAQADVVICRAGASTVTELAAVGVAAVFVPLPHAVDDHQSTNARFLVDQGGGWLIPQSELTAKGLADMLLNMERTTLLEKAQKAKNMQKTGATEAMVAACASWARDRV